jgi:hypothetical protein
LIERRWSVPALAVAASVLVVVILVAPALTAARSQRRIPLRVPAPLSAATSRVNINSSAGSGSFGKWFADADGLPAYRYTLNEETAPQAAQPELDGARDGVTQIGNDRVVAAGFNHGYVQLWSQDHTYQWMNKYDASADHFSGGYGYIDLGGHTYSTLYDDRAPDETVTRVMGVDYMQTVARVPGLTVDAKVYAPWGNYPLLLHDVTLTNTSGQTENPTWWEYWDVNPVMPPTGLLRGTEAPVWDPANDTLSVAQTVTAQDLDPMSIFATALSGPVAGFETETKSFFGSGGRADPAAVVANRASDSIAPANIGYELEGSTMFAFRSPVTLAPGKSITLRYAYGYDAPSALNSLVAEYRGEGSQFQKTEQVWRRYVPQVNVGSHYTWLSRELQWDAYMLRSDETYESCAGYHILSQGGYYQYGLGFQGAYRDPLELMLPMIYEDPDLARQVILYSAEEQTPGSDLIPYARLSNCLRFDLGTSDDLDDWLLMSAAEYALATRDFNFFNTPVKWAEGTETATLWTHLKQAFNHEQLQLLPNGDYLTGATGDWSDLSTAELQMTESALVTSQGAYTYPRLAEAARDYGDDAFATQLQAAGEADVESMRRQWVGRGWYARGYSVEGQLGVGAIFEEPQPFSILAGTPSRSQAITLVHNIRRFLTGVGAPGGPSPIGSAQSPAADDPLVTEHSTPAQSNGAAVFVGGVWYSLNGWLTWALGSLQGVVPHADSYAFNELIRNTLWAHANAYPDSWDGILSVDDVCNAWYDKAKASQCGVGLSSAWDTMIPHQDAWSLWDTIELAGIHSEQNGFQIVPEFPMTNFSVRFQGAGVARQHGLIRGYITTVGGGALTMDVAAAPGTTAAQDVAFADGHQVSSRVVGGLVQFTLLTRPGVAANWAVELR